MPLPGFAAVLFGCLTVGAPDPTYFWGPVLGPQLLTPYLPVLGPPPFPSPTFPAPQV